MAPDNTDHLRQIGRNLLFARQPDAALDLIAADFAARGPSVLEELPHLWGGHNGLAFHGVSWSLTQLERLGGLLIQAYPVASDPDYEDGSLLPHQELRDLRNRLVTALLNHPEEEHAASVLDRLAPMDPEVRARVDTYRANQRAAQFLPGVDPSAARDPAALSVHDAVRLLDRAGYRLLDKPED